MRGEGVGSTAQMENGDGYGRMSDWAIHASRQYFNPEPSRGSNCACPFTTDLASQKLIRGEQEPVQRGIETSGPGPAMADGASDKIEPSDPQTCLGHRHTTNVRAPTMNRSIENKPLRDHRTTARGGSNIGLRTRGLEGRSREKKKKSTCAVGVNMKCAR
jgi:hypothetical protein